MTGEVSPIEMNEFQRRILTLPEELDLYLLGGRGGGKSYGIALLILSHIERYAADARVLFIRKTYKGLADFELVTRDLFGRVYGTDAKYNQAEHVWRFPNGAYVELGQLESAADYTKYQGRSFTLLIVDEAGQYTDSTLLDMMRSNLRGRQGLPIRMVIAANPAGAGHYWLANRYALPFKPWEISYEPRSKRNGVFCPSTFAENHFIDREQYADQLQSACPDDPELLEAWVNGNWAVNRGAYFASVLDDKRVAVDDWDELPDGFERPFLAHDFGSSAPSVTYLLARSNSTTVNGQYFPRNSLVAIDELATCKSGSLNDGLGYTVPRLAEEIKAMCARWNVSPQGVADDACFARGGHAAGSIADEFRQCGVYFHPARKADRVTGWNRMRKLLSNAGAPDRAGLYVARRCGYFWATVPTLARDARRIEDVDSSGADHGADAIRYGCLQSRPIVATGIR